MAGRLLPYNAAMEDGHPDDVTLSPEDLKRLGLGGQGNLIWLMRRFEGFPEFFGALRPSWRGALLTILLCWGLCWFDWHLSHALHPAPFFTEVGLPEVTLVEALSAPFEELAAAPLRWPLRCLTSQWSMAEASAAPFLAIFLAIILFRSSRARPGRLWAGGALAALTVTGVGFSLFASDRHWMSVDYFTVQVVESAVLLAGATTALWLVVRATGLSRERVCLSDCALALFLATLLALNLRILTGAPTLSLRFFFRGPIQFSGAEFIDIDFHRTVWDITGYTVPVLGGLLLFTPALVVLRGYRFVSAGRTVVRFAIARPAVLVAALGGLALVASLPIGRLLLAVPTALGWIGIVDLFPGSFLRALSEGIHTGLCVYATALVATALHDSLPAAVDATPTDAD